MVGAERQNAMIEGQTKVRGGSSKQVEHFRSKKYPFDAALLE